MAHKTLAAQGAAERRKRDLAITSAQGGTTRAGRRAGPEGGVYVGRSNPAKAANTRTAQTARQRSVVAKRKIASQVRSAPGGRTKAQGPSTLAQIGQSLIDMGTAYLNAPMTFGVAGEAVKHLTKPKAKPKPKPRKRTRTSYRG